MVLPSNRQKNSYLETAPSLKPLKSNNLNRRDGTKLVAWFQKNKVPHPWRCYWQESHDPYFVWISEIMLQQTSIATVIPRYIEFIEKFKNITLLSRASETSIRKYTAGMGYYRRFRFMQQMAIEVGKRENFPQTYQELLKMPGIGPYTAAAISSICFNEPQAVVDGNVERVLCRLYDIREAPNSPLLKKEYPRLLESFFNKNYPGDFNEGIMELGQKICTPNKPNCPECVFNKKCLSFKESSQHLAPAKKIKKNKKEVYCEITVKINGNRIALEDRREESKFLRNTTGFRHKICSPVKEFDFQHTITNHKIKAIVKISSSNSTKFKWLPISLASSQLETSFDKKAFKIVRDKIAIMSGFSQKD